MRLLLIASVLIHSLLFASRAALAGELNIDIDIPQLNVAEYHRPYFALWVEDEKGQNSAHLQLWYDGETRWLHHMRRWWRRVGRDATLPIDGVTGATRGPGGYQLTFNSKNSELSKLAPGKYDLVIEVSREVGGRELIRMPFEWPINNARTETAAGEIELGNITLTLNP
ncbi:MAG: DUF2271 domain-containing protein [Alcanivoracaceae bacterium]|nr:DUF2271 domain-containing protein [Alcanivoracaceae bacterium]